MSIHETKDVSKEQRVLDDEKIVKEIKDEIKTFGENQKVNEEKLNKGYEELKKLVDDTKSHTDVLVKEQMAKLSSDIATRQEELDKKVVERSEELQKKIEVATQERDTKLHERMDQVEVALKRTPKENSQLSVEEEVELKSLANQFFTDALVIGDTTGKGATYERVNSIKVNVEDYKLYTKSFGRFIRTHEKFITPEDTKALQVGFDPDGGYTVTPAMSNRIIRRLFETDPIRQLASVETISTGAIEWLVDFDEAGWGWEGETRAGAETDTPQIFKKRIPVHVLYAKPRATQTLLEDSGINAENWLADKVSDRFARGEAAAFVTGDGVGKPRGFLTYVNGTDYGQIERTNMGHATEFTADGIISVKYSLIEQYLNRGTWVMNRLAVADIMKLKDGNGNYIWKPGLAEERYSTLLGLPVRMSTTVPIAAAGSLSLAIADWKEAYMVVDRLGITVQRDPYTQKPFVEFYTRKRVGGDVVNFQAIKIGVVAA